MRTHNSNVLTVIAKDEKEYFRCPLGKRLITFYVETLGGLENDVEVISKIMPPNPSIVLIQPGLCNRLPISTPDKLVTMMGNIWNGGFQFKYRRLDCETETNVAYRFDFLVLE
jgi:hypothetical protein